MAKPKTSHSEFDIALRVLPFPEQLTTIGRAIVKLTYAIDPHSGALRPTTPVALVNDIEDESLKPRLPPHSDFWPTKRLADIAVIGSAFAKDDKAVPERLVELAIGNRRKVIRVHGTRELSVGRGGTVNIGQALPYTEMPLGIEHAYGGLDGRAKFDWNNPQEATTVAIKADWPGLYPRNPWGRGYLCVTDPVKELTMPSQEDPQQPLTADTLISNPEHWYQRPMPAYFDWTPINCFPRNLFYTIECEPWFSPPQDERLPEIRDKLLPSNYRELLKDQLFGMPPHWKFMQESAPFQSFGQKALLAAPIKLTGMHPEHDELKFTLPPPPELLLAFETERQTPEPRLTSVELNPAELTVSLTYTAEITAPRMFLTGVHPEIPFGVIVNGSKPVWYDTPTTIRSVVKAAETET